MNKGLNRPFAALLSLLLIIILCLSFTACKDQKTDEEESREFTLPGKYYESAGSATSFLKIDEQQEDGGYPAVVLWGYSKDTYTEWTMTLYEQPGGIYTYTDCVCNEITVDEAGNLIALTSYENGSGHFTLGNWLMYWDGAQESGVQGCVFEK